jgi:hypothetical protein
MGILAQTKGLEGHEYSKSENFRFEIRKMTELTSA